MLSWQVPEGIGFRKILRQTRAHREEMQAHNTHQSWLLERFPDFGILCGKTGLKKSIT